MCRQFSVASNLWLCDSYSSSRCCILPRKIPSSDSKPSAERALPALRTTYTLFTLYSFLENIFRLKSVPNRVLDSACITSCPAAGSKRFNLRPRIRERSSDANKPRLPTLISARSCPPLRPTKTFTMLINGEKYACEACVRGHRVSSCTHNGQCHPPGACLAWLPFDL